MFSSNTMTYFLSYESVCVHMWDRKKGKITASLIQLLTLLLHYTYFYILFPVNFKRAIKISKRKSNIGVTFFRIYASIWGIWILNILSVYEYIMFSVSLTIAVSWLILLSNFTNPVMLLVKFYPTEILACVNIHTIQKCYFVYSMAFTIEKI